MKCSEQSIRRSSKVRLAALAAVAGIAGFGSVAKAQFIWDAGASPDNTWTNPLNWNADFGFPTAADSAQWTVNGGTPTPSTVDLSADAAASDLQVVDREVTFNLNSFDLSVGPNLSHFDGNDGHVILDGNNVAGSSVTFSGTIRVGANAPAQGTLATGSRLTVRGGVKVSSGAVDVARYRGAGIILVDGAGTEWNSSGAVTLNVSAYAPYGSIYQQPRAQLLITNGGVFNHDTGNTGSPAVFSISRNNILPESMESKIVVDGPGSQLNILGNYAYNFQVGGYGAATNWEFTNGGVLNSPLNLGMSFLHESDPSKGPNINTYTISGANSKMSALAWGLALRSSDSSTATGNTVVNVLAGGTFEATGKDGSDRSVTVGNRGRLSLAGGTVAIPLTGEVVLRDTGVPTTPAILEGFGTITGGSLRVKDNSILRPGGVAATGTLTLSSGNLIAETTGVGSASLEFDLSTSSSAHDRIALLSAGSSATIPGAFDYNNIGSGTGGSGNLDFLLADTISYSGLNSGDITSGIDDLESIMSAAGFTRVFTDPAAANEYRYFIAPDVSGTLDALRLQLFAAVVGESVWNKDDSVSNWTDSGSWTGGVPNAAGAVATFGSIITANQTVNVDAGVTVGTMNFNNANSYTLAGNSITMDVSSGSAAINVVNGSHTISSALNLSDDTTVDVAGSNTLTVSNLQSSSVNVSKTGTGKLAVNNVRTSGTLSVGGGSVEVTAQANPFNASSAAGVSSVGSLSVTSGTVNIQNNKLVTNSPVGSWNGSEYTGVTGLIQDGRGTSFAVGTDPHWDGTTGIITGQTDATLSTLHSIGVAKGSDVLKSPANPLNPLGATETTTWAGQTVTGDSTLVMYSWGGDAGMDGDLDGDDYFVLDSNIGLSGSVFGFAKGDLDYDGDIDGDDYFIIDSNIGTATSSGNVFYTAGGVDGGGAGLAAVPEPASIGVLGLAATALLGRRRRRA